MKTIYLDSTLLHDYANIANSIFVKQSIEGLDMPEIRTSQSNRAGEYGVNIVNQLYGGRMITIEGGIYATDKATFEAKRRALLNALKIVKNSQGFVTRKIFKCTTLNDLAVQCEVIVNKVNMAWVKENYVEYQIELISPDYLLTSQTLKTSTANIVQDGGAIYPVIYPVIYGSSSSSSMTVTNAGESEAWPIVEIVGPVSSPVITNATIDKYIALDVSIEAGETMTIDMVNKTILINGENSMYTLDLESEWLWLEPGANTINISTSGGSGSISFKFRDSYIGI